MSNKTKVEVVAAAIEFRGGYRHAGDTFHVTDDELTELLKNKLVKKVKVEDKDKPDGKAEKMDKVGVENKALSVDIDNK